MGGKECEDAEKVVKKDVAFSWKVFIVQGEEPIMKKPKFKDDLKAKFIQK